MRELKKLVTLMLKRHNSRTHMPNHFVARAQHHHNIEPYPTYSIHDCYRRVSVFILSRYLKVKQLKRDFFFLSLSALRSVFLVYCIRIIIWHERSIVRKQIVANLLKIQYRNSDIIRPLQFLESATTDQSGSISINCQFFCFLRIVY